MDSRSGSATHQLKHDVFLSFRGEDTRNNFTSHLHGALARKSIVTFMDKNGLQGGEKITPTISKAIEDSTISVIVFSESYGSSTWCLDEVAKIIDCHETRGQLVLPVFYHVNPSDVKKQTGAFGEAFARHARDFQHQFEKVKMWEEALRKAADFSGFNSDNTRPESKLVNDIVISILKHLKQPSSSVLEGLVGIDSRIEKIKALLSIRSSNVRMIGIWGMGGIGKTTLAEAVFNQIASEFEGCCFLANVREKSEKCGGLTCLQEELLSKTLKERDIKIDSPNIGYSFYVQKILRHKRVLIVLDDVNSSEQLESLVGNRHWFGQGSQIIVTSRDKQVLRKTVDVIYEVEGLLHHEALQLFNMNAFKEKHPAEDYLALSQLVIEYANGIALALKVLGSFLFGKSKRDWESALDKLKKAPHRDIQNVLKISFDGLDAEEKDIFLHVACFFRGESMDMVTRILDGCGFSTNIGLQVLIDKSLISISNNQIEMHDLLQEMGKEIVRQESKEPGRRSRLWNHDDILHVLKKNMGTEAIEGIFLDMSKLNKIDMNSNAFQRMSNLKFLKFYMSDVSSGLEVDNKVYLSKSLESLPDELRYLHWHGCPLKYLPTGFQLANLMVLELPHSKLKQLWKRNKDLKMLKEIDLHYSKDLINIPELPKARNLTYLKLSGCKKLRSLPSTMDLRSLITLDLNDCSSLETFPEISKNISSLYLSRTAIKELPSSIAYLRQLRLLEMNCCTKLESLPSSICKLESLETLSLHGCSNLQYFPDISDAMYHLKVLVLNGTGIKELPSSIERLKGLSSIYLESCKNLAHLPESFCNLTTLSLVFLTYCSKLERLPKKFSNLKILEDLMVGGCNLLKLPSDLNCLSAISKLDLSGNNFEKLPASIKLLSHLHWLDISSCKRLRSIIELPPSLTDIDAYDCKSLETISGLKKLFQLSYADSYYRKKFIFTCCFKLVQNAWSDLLADAQSWICEVATRVTDEESFSIWYPGNKIPEWFRYQSEGSSIIIQLPLLQHKNRLLGFALCVVLTFKDNFEYHNSFFDVMCTYHFKNSNGACSARKEFYSSKSHVFGDAKHVWSEHVLMFYDPNFPATNANEYSYDEASFRFYWQNNDSYCTKSCKVKKCGVHPLYAKEDECCNRLEVPQEIMMDRIDDKENERKRSWDGSESSDDKERYIKKLKPMKSVFEQ